MRVLTLEEMELVAGGSCKPKSKSSCKPKSSSRNCGPKKPSRGGCNNNSSSEDGGDDTPPPLEVPPTQ